MDKLSVWFIVLLWAVSISVCQQISFWLAVTVLNLELNPTKPLVLKLWGNTYVKRWKCNMFAKPAEKWHRNLCLRYCLTICRLAYCFPKGILYLFSSYNWQRRLEQRFQKSLWTFKVKRISLGLCCNTPAISSCNENIPFVWIKKKFISIFGLTVESFQL